MFYSVTVCLVLVLASHAVAVAENSGSWNVATKDDRFDGKTTSIYSTPLHDGSSLNITYLHKCDQCLRWLRFRIAYRLGRKLNCPYEEETVLGKTNHVHVKWILDSGPIHHQKYRLASTGDFIYFDWRLSSVEQKGFIDRYTSVAEAYTNTPKDQYYSELKRQKVIPADDMTKMLAKGQRLHLRASDKCEEVNLEVDLRGLAAAITRADLTPRH